MIKLTWISLTISQSHLITNTGRKGQQPKLKATLTFQGGFF